MFKSIKSLFSDRQGLALVEFALIAPLLFALFFGTVEFARYIIIMQKVERSAYSLSNLVGQYTPITYYNDPSEIDVDALTNEIFPQFQRNMEPYVDAVDRIAVITSISRVSNANNNNSIVINWQRSGGGEMSESPALSGVGGDDDKDDDKYHRYHPIASDISSVVDGYTPSSMNSSTDGAASGKNPTFPRFASSPATYNSTLMNGTLRDMAVGENMLIVEVFYHYKPMISSVLNRLGLAYLAESTLKSVVYSRPRNGDLLTLVRPTEPPPPEETTPTVNIRDYCDTVEIDPPVYQCSNNYVTGVRTCRNCSRKEICYRCTSTVDDPESCITVSSSYRSCVAAALDGEPNGEPHPVPPPPTN